MKRTVHLGKPTRDQTPFEIFPDPRTVFAEWNDDMAARLLPLARFDLALADDEESGKGVFLFCEDYGVDFLSWEVDDRGLITKLDQDWRKIDPFEQYSPVEDVAKFKAEKGAYLKFEKFEIEIGPPSEFEDGDTSWCSAFIDAMIEVGADDAGGNLRLGGGYPCYVQSTIPMMDDPGYLGEIATYDFGLPPVYLYLTGGDKTFTQDMQMT